MWQRVCKCEDSRCVVATLKANERRSDAVDDSRPSTDENENGMNGAASVMKAAGQWTKGSCTVSPYFNARVVAKGSCCYTCPKVECISATDLDELALLCAEAALRRAGRTVTVRLRAQPMREAMEWLRRYERFWSSSLDRLTSYAESKEAEVRRKGR